MSSPENYQEEQRPPTTTAAMPPSEETPHIHSHFYGMIQRMEEGHVRELFFLYRHPWQLLWINFLAGLARGVGLTIGTALFLALAAYVLGKFITLPLIGEYIARLLDIVDTYRNGSFYR